MRKAQGHSQDASRPGGRGLALLVLPALVFVLLVLLAPVGGFLWLAVDNSDLNAELPHTIAALTEAEAAVVRADAPSMPPPTDQIDAAHISAPKDQQDAAHIGAALGRGDVAQKALSDVLPPEQVFAALVLDLAKARAERRDGLIAQALNQRLVGTRLLVIRSAQAAEKGAFAPPYRDSLLAAFPGWGEPDLWRVLRQDSGPLTDFHLLASLDLRRSADGEITNAPPEQRQFRRIFARTLWISAVVTAICALLALPVAQAIVSAPKRLGQVIFALVLFPLWTSLLVRTVIWIIVLQKQGPVNAALLDLGLIAQPLSLIYTRGSLYLAMVQVLLPLMVLSLVAVLQRLSPQHMRAALSLGASWPVAWVTVQLPLIMPGLLAGAGITFVFALGYYVTPLLVGGPGEQMISALIAFYTNETLNWGLAAALSLQVLLLVLAAGFGALLLTGLGKLTATRPALPAPRQPSHAPRSAKIGPGQ